MPLNLQGPTPPTVNINYLDASEGVGYKTLYGTAYRVGNASEYTVVTNPFVAGGSNLGFTRRVAATGDLDFVYTFPKPTLLDGVVVITVPFGVYKSTGSSQNVVGKIELYKTINGVETQIGVQAEYDSGSLTIVADTTTIAVMNANFDIGRQKFAKGDSIKVSVEHNAPAANHSIITYHNPSNGNDWESKFSVSRTALEINIPVKITS